MSGCRVTDGNVCIFVIASEGLPSLVVVLLMGMCVCLS